MKKSIVLLLTFISLVAGAQQHGTDEQLLNEFRNMKFGLFVHWGPVSLRGTEIGWSRGREVPADEYDSLYQAFNPVKFDANAWIKTLKAAGMKYFIITSRHHDGFSLWPAAFSDYTIQQTPFRRDVLMEMKEACDRHGILFGTYYSICDWKHPLYPLGSPGGKTTKETGDMERFVPVIKAQTKELVEKYGSKIMWFDGEWEEPWTHEMGLDLYRYLKGLNENILINNRVDKGRKGMEGITISEEYAGDFATPEQRVGTYNTGQPWESCITLCTQWSWKPGDTMKSLEECLFTLIKTVGGGGNLLLNVGPMPDGRIEPRQAERLKEMGKWLDRYGESIYGTAGGPFKPTDWIASTRKGNAIYLHLLNYNKNQVELSLPAEVDVTGCSLLKGKKLDFRRDADNLKIMLPPNSRAMVTVIKVMLGQPANEIAAIEI